MSLLGNDLLQDTLVIHATQVNGLWTLDSLTTGSVVGHGHACGFLWQVDECGMVCVGICCRGMHRQRRLQFHRRSGREDGSCTYPGDSCDDGDEATVDETLDDNCGVVATDDVIEKMSGSLCSPTLQRSGSLSIQRRRWGNPHCWHGWTCGPREKAEGLVAGVHMNLNLPNGLYLCELTVGPNRFTIR